MSDHEPTEDGAPADDGALTLEPSDTGAGSGGSSRGALPWIAVAGVFVLLLAVLGVVVAQRSSDDEAEPEPLPLVGGSQAESDTASAMIAPAVDIEYRLEGDLPDLGSEAPVYRVTRPELDADQVGELAEGFGVKGEVLTQANTWEVSGEGGLLAVYPSNSTWTVSYSPIAGPTAGGSSSGSAVESAGSGEAPATEPATDPTKQPVTTVPADQSDSTVSPDQPVTNVPDQGVVESPDLTPANLPSEEEAEQIARDLLDAAGVLDDGEWQVDVNDSSVALATTPCFPGEDCAAGPAEDVVLSRGVVFHRVVDGVTTTGLDWFVDVGDEGAIGSATGTLATLDKVADYPLRTTQAVYDDLVAGRGFQPGPVPMLGAEASTFTDMGEPVTGSGATEECDSEGNCTATTYTCPGSPLCDAVDPAAPSTTTTILASEADPCTTNPNGIEICSSPPDTGSGIPPDEEGCVEVDEQGGSRPCPDTTVPGVTFPVPEPETIVVTITDAALGAQVIPAIVDGEEAAYLVPTYVFIGTYEDGIEFRTELVAIDSSLIAPPAEPEPVPPETIIVPPDTAIDVPPASALPPDSIAGPTEPGGVTGGGSDPDDGTGATGVTSAESGG